MPVSSNVSHQTVSFVNSPITFKSCLRKHISASLSNSTANTNCKLRSRALNTCQIRKHIQPSAEQGTARLLKDKYTALVPRISEWPEPHPSEQKAGAHDRQWQSSAFAHCGKSQSGKMVGASPKRATCAPGLGNVQWRRKVSSARRALMANPSLNRTFCGSPGLGFISFSPKPGPPQNAG